MKHRAVSRRSFLQSAAAGAGAASLALPAHAAFPFIWRRRSRPDALNVACVGCGGKGQSDIQAVRDENIVALCDVDFQRGYPTFRDFPAAKRYRDYRQMLTDLDQKIDAVVVSTPDHMHFPIAMMAMEMGKHVYVQKPIAHTVWEARELARKAEQTGVATQMGNQGHANEGTRLVYEWVRSGAIGPVREVHLYTNRPIWPQAQQRPVTAQNVPATLDWDLWLGVAPERPYHASYLPFNWRGWWDFGCGALGDMGCHIMDAAFWALDLDAPDWVEAESDAVTADTTPTWSVVTYQFPARGDLPPVRVVWYDGDKKPPRPAALEQWREPPQDNGQLIIGDDATIMAGTYCSSPRIIPEARMKEVGKPERTVPRVKGGPHKEWLQACKGGRKAGSNFVDHAGRLTEAVLLGNVAIRTGRRVHWDAAHLACPGSAQAQALLRHPFRVS